MTYYKDTGTTEDYYIQELHKVKAPDENEFFYLVSEFKALQNFDFKNFNYYVFEQEIMEEMSLEEFQWWFEKYFEQWLNFLDENYLDISFEDLNNRFNSIEERRIFFMQLVNFVMFLFPYQLFKNILKELKIENSSQLLDYLNDDANLINLRTLIMQEIDKNMTQFEDFIDILQRFEKVAKKNLVEENIELLDEHIQKQNFFLEIFKGIIQEADMTKVKNLIEKIIETDSDNIF